MKNIDPTEVLNDNIDFLIDHLKREIGCLGKINGLSDSQISDMERDFIARLAFAAIIGDDGKEDEKEPEKEPEKKSEALPEYVVKALPEYVVRALLYVKRLCEAHEDDCDECLFSTGAGLCRLCEVPSKWEA